MDKRLLILNVAKIGIAYLISDIQSKQRPIKQTLHMADFGDRAILKKLNAMISEDIFRSITGC